jgi:hypothetical protein
MAIGLRRIEGAAAGRFDDAGVPTGIDAFLDLRIMG